MTGHRDVTPFKVLTGRCFDGCGDGRPRYGPAEGSATCLVAPLQGSLSVTTLSLPYPGNEAARVCGREVAPVCDRGAAFLVMSPIDSKTRIRTVGQAIEVASIVAWHRGPSGPSPAPSHGSWRYLGPPVMATRPHLCATEAQQSSCRVHHNSGWAVSGSTRWLPLSRTRQYGLSSACYPPSVRWDSSFTAKR